MSRLKAWWLKLDKHRYLCTRHCKEKTILYFWKYFETIVIYLFSYPWIHFYNSNKLLRLSFRKNLWTNANISGVAKIIGLYSVMIYRFFKRSYCSLYPRLQREQHFCTSFILAEFPRILKHRLGPNNSRKFTILTFPNIRVLTTFILKYRWSDE